MSFVEPGSPDDLVREVRARFADIYGGARPWSAARPAG